MYICMYIACITISTCLHLILTSAHSSVEECTKTSKRLNGAPRQSRFLDQKNFAVFPVSRHFSCSKDFAVSLFPDTFRNQGILMFCPF